MMKVWCGRDVKCRVDSEVNIGRMNILITQFNNALKYFDAFFSRVHSTSPHFALQNAEVIELTITNSKDL